MTRDGLRRWLWRIGVGVSLVASAIRSGGLGPVLGGLAWYALQFGPLLAIGIGQALRLSRKTLWVPRDRLLVGSTLALTILAAGSALWSVGPLASLGQAGILALCVLFLLTTYLVRWRSQSALFGDLSTVYWVGIGLQLIGLLGYAIGQPWAVWQANRLVGVMANPNYTGMAAALLIALAFAVPGRAMRVAAVVPLFTLFLTGSRGALVGVVAGVVALFLLVPAVRPRAFERILGAITAVGLPLLFVFVARPPSWLILSSGGQAGSGPVAPGSSGAPIGPEDVTSGRLQIYFSFLEQWTRTPIAGVGYRASTAAQLGLNYEAHNVYLSVLVELGLIGVGVFLALIVGLGRASSRTSALICAATTVLVSDLFESTLFGLGGPTALTSWLVLFAWAATGSHAVATDDSPRSKADPGI